MQLWRSFFLKLYLIYQVTDNMPLTNKLVSKHKTGLMEVPIILKPANHSPYPVGFLPQPGLRLDGGSPYKSADKNVRDLSLVPFVTV